MVYAGSSVGVHRLPPVAGRIRDSDIAEVRDRVRVDEVIGEYVALRRAGAGSLKGLCPFHDEKTPSFNVRPSHGTFHCFGCGEGGDALWLAEHGYTVHHRDLMDLHVDQLHASGIPSIHAAEGDARHLDNGRL